MTTAAMTTNATKTALCAVRIRQRQRDGGDVSHGTDDVVADELFGGRLVGRSVLKDGDSRTKF
jgi:hypothetical protein